MGSQAGKLVPLRHEETARQCNVPRIIRVACVATALVGMTACAGTAGGYHQQLRQATRKADVFNLNSLRAELMWHATLLTDDLRAARVTYEANLRGMAPEQIDRQLPIPWSASGTTFLVSLYAPKEVQALALDGESYWRLELSLPSGAVHESVAIEEAPVTPLERKLFPFVHQWARTYFVRFAPPVETGTIRLTIRGLHARSVLQWKIP